MSYPAASKSKQHHKNQDTWHNAQYSGKNQENTNYLVLDTATPDQTKHLKLIQFSYLFDDFLTFIFQL